MAYVDPILGAAALEMRVGKFAISVVISVFRAKEVTSNWDCKIVYILYCHGKHIYMIN